MVGEARSVAGVRLDQGDRDYVYARVDPEADAVVGLQIEHFLSRAIEQHPDLIDVLDASTLASISRAVLNLISCRHPERPRRLNRFTGSCQRNCACKNASPSSASASWVSASGRQIAAARAIVWLSGVNDSMTMAPS
jgi:hypothetical protein